MNDNDVPILRKIHELYKTFHEYRNLVPKQEDSLCTNGQKISSLIFLNCA
jgi:hypothetical protein